ncbi:MAG: LLM class flavin-dependent oxidoreductase [Candidatus Eremiobacteraeota bacterium]|nr:LLM class flavin-dependent oxidoreductase [Candidatus Eremiobacteraeota bacterium]
MKQAINVPPFGAAAEPRFLMQLAREAEAAGWDGFFVWDHMNWMDWGPEIADPWVALAAVATVTSTIRLGPMVTPMPRRDPTKLARETVSLDRLSGGRLTLGLGLGAPDPEESADIGLPLSYKLRAQRAEEGYELLRQLWTGQPVDHQGEHYHLKSRGFLPRPLQEPSIPVWWAAMLPGGPGPLGRAARADGIVPWSSANRPLEIAELRQLVDQVRALRGDGDFDVVYGCRTGQDPEADRQTLRAHAEAGVTWWLESLAPWDADFETHHARLRQGPTPI